ncbi:MAG: WecB/TagA/CpsF family glycosyltransferase [Bacteroidaceae bacterium]|jgi:exopolysaccharide biosynthesis WecB/TagA/CpsF family protein|nr:WecB/TagA/CpsF family glycosyltransferase [Bacteroidaceae bacterium]
MSSTTILNIDIINIDREEFLSVLDKGVLITPNLDHLIKLQYDKEFYDCYKRADWVVCDSRVLCLLSRLLRNPIQEAIPGSSFFTSYYMYHKDDPDCRIFLLGAKEGVAQKAMTKINERVGRDIVIGALSPSFGFENNEQECSEIVKTINASEANVVLVGVGAPKQEKWIFKFKEQMPNIKLWMALGATIDFEAGNIKRAPQWMQTLGMEWFYRFLMEPKRLFKRYFIDDMRFFYYFSKQLLGVYKNPFANN